MTKLLSGVAKSQSKASSALCSGSLLAVAPTPRTIKVAPTGTRYRGVSLGAE